MRKEAFIEVLKKKGYQANLKNGIIEIPLVGATKEEVKQTYISVHLIAKKSGYNHSIRVFALAEVSGEE